MKVVVILGTARNLNKSQLVFNFISGKLKKQPNVEPSLLNLGDAEFPAMRERFVKSEDGDLLSTWVNEITASKGIIIIAPEYKNGYPGSLKNFLDYLPSGIFKYKVVGIVSVSSGYSGGANCLAQLRLVVLSMGGVVIPDRFQVARVHEIFTDPSSELPLDTIQTAEKFISEFLKYVKAIQVLN